MVKNLSQKNPIHACLPTSSDTDAGVGQRRPGSLWLSLPLSLSWPISLLWTFASKDAGPAPLRWTSPRRCPIKIPEDLSGEGRGSTPATNLALAPPSAEVKMSPAMASCEAPPWLEAPLVEIRSSESNGGGGGDGRWRELPAACYVQHCMYRYEIPCQCSFFFIVFLLGFLFSRRLAIVFNWV